LSVNNISDPFNVQQSTAPSGHMDERSSPFVEIRHNGCFRVRGDKYWEKSNRRTFPTREFRIDNLDPVAYSKFLKSGHVRRQINL